MTTASGGTRTPRAPTLLDALLPVVVLIGLIALTIWLFGVSATDVPSFARALAIVMSVVIVATLVPAWRASRMNPLSALRHQ